MQSNTTDNESGLIKSAKGYIQGYNGTTIADSGSQIIIAAEVTGGAAEGGMFPQMLNNLEENMKTLTGKEEPLKKAIAVGDTGNFSEGNLQEAAGMGVEVLIPDPQFSYKCPQGNMLTHQCHQKLRNNSGHKYQAKRGACKGCPLLEKCINVKTGKNPVRTLYAADQKYEENLSEKMREKIDRPVNREIYSRRQQIIEPVFSDIAYCKGMNRFTLRANKKVTTQLQLYCIVHNIGKCVKPLCEKYGK